MKKRRNYCRVLWELPGQGNRHLSKSAPHERMPDILHPYLSADPVEPRSCLLIYGITIIFISYWNANISVAMNSGCTVWHKFVNRHHSPAYIQNSNTVESVCVICNPVITRALKILPVLGEDNSLCDSLNQCSPSCILLSLKISYCW